MLLVAIKRMELFAKTVPANNTFFVGIVPENNTLFVRGGGGGVRIRLSFFLSIVWHASKQRRTPAPSAERQHPETWPASTYGHLRGVSNYEEIP